jgi:hypothetical protein
MQQQRIVLGTGLEPLDALDGLHQGVHQIAELIDRVELVDDFDPESELEEGLLAEHLSDVFVVLQIGGVVPYSIEVRASTTRTASCSNRAAGTITPC